MLSLIRGLLDHELEHVDCPLSVRRWSDAFICMLALPSTFIPWRIDRRSVRLNFRTWQGRVPSHCML